MSVLNKTTYKKIFSLIILSLTIIFCVGCSNSPSSKSNHGNNTAADSSSTQSSNSTSGNVKLYDSFIASIVADFKMSETTINFLNENSSLFPSKTDSDLQKLNSLIDYTIQYKHLDKSMNSYLNKVMNVYGRVQEIKELDFNGQTITFMQVVTESNESYLAVYLGNLTNLFKNCTVTVTCLPVTPMSVNNDIGGTTNNILVIVGYLENLGEGAPVDGVQ